MLKRNASGKVFYSALVVAYFLGWCVISAFLPGDLSRFATFPLLIYSLAVVAWLAMTAQRSAARFERFSLVDPRMGLYNERYFLKALNLEFQRSRRHGLPLAMAIFSWEGENEALPTGNHHSLDGLLSQVVSRTIRSSDIFAMLGNGKYSLLLPNTPVEGAQVAANRLKTNLRAELKKVRPSLRLLVPFGICGTSAEGIVSMEEMLAGSDQAYASARQSPRNHIVTCGDLCR